MMKMKFIQKKLNGTQLEYDFIGILLSNPKLIMKYYF